MRLGTRTRALLDPHRQGREASAQRAFDDYWFGARSLACGFCYNMRIRFGEFPRLEILHRWAHVAGTAASLSLASTVSRPLYRASSLSTYNRRAGPYRGHPRSEPSWVGQRERIGDAQLDQFASKRFCGVFSRTRRSNRDPSVVIPRAGRSAGYLMYSARGQFEHVLQNSYLTSVGSVGRLEHRLRGCRNGRQRQDDL